MEISAEEEEDDAEEAQAEDDAGSDGSWEDIEVEEVVGDDEES